MPGEIQFVKFSDFLESLKEPGVPEAPAADGQINEAEKKIAHLRSLYSNVDVEHSFMDENGQHFDCIPLDQQLGARTSDAPVTSNAPELPGTVPGAQKQVIAGSVVNDQVKDAAGNTRACPPGTIPVRRITKEELARFPTLEQFFRKGPVGRGRVPALSPPDISSAAHRYAHAAQLVNNIGGHSFMSVWTPTVTGDQIFSLSQHWYAAQGHAGVQTVEAGWQVFPQKYKTLQPALFVYFTADGYTNTGSYNLENGDFVQTNSSWALGGALSPSSQIGGPIQEIEIAYLMKDGKWWLYVNGVPIGYYPISKFQGGPMANSAAWVDYGGETLGTTSYPPMGSGQFASAGQNQAASQRDIYYFPADGSDPQLVNLTPDQASKSCYTIDYESAAPPWNKYFFFGGPGGSGCSN